MSKWCEHMSASGDYFTHRERNGVTRHCPADDFQYCPICGTPRPKEKSLAERLRDIYISGDDRYLPWDEVGPYDKCKWQAVAKEAERYFDEKH